MPLVIDLPRPTTTPRVATGPATGGRCRPPVGDATRRQFLGILTAAGLLTACASTDAGRSGDAAAASRRVTDDAGREVNVPVRPGRIVGFNEFGVGEAVLSLGGPLVGLTVDTGIGGFNPPTAAAYDLSAVTPVGGYGEEDAEAITALRPDLIIGETYGGAYNHGIDVEDLQRIAPTFLVDPTRGRDHYLTRIAEVLGAEDELQRQKDAYLLRAREIGERLPAGLSGVVFTGVYGGELSYYSSRSQNPLPAALVDIGVGIPAAADQPPTDGADYRAISIERLLDPDLQADVILSENRGDTPQEQTPLWSRLPAVAAGQAHEIGPPAGTSYRTGRTVLDLLEPLLVGADPAVVD